MTFIKRKVKKFQVVANWLVRSLNSKEKGELSKWQYPHPPLVWLSNTIPLMPLLLKMAHLYNTRRFIHMETRNYRNDIKSWFQFLNRKSQRSKKDTKKILEVHEHRYSAEESEELKNVHDERQRQSDCYSAKDINPITRNTKSKSANLVKHISLNLDETVGAQRPLYLSPLLAYPLKKVWGGGSSLVAQ